jgi:hypothetical protein
MKQAQIGERRQGGREREAGGSMMKRMRWRQLLTAGLVATGLTSGALWAQEPAAKNEEQTIMLREPGKADRPCIVEKSTQQPDGTVVYEVRDAATGERLRVMDQRRHKSAAGSAKVRTPGPGASEVATAAVKEPDRVPTNAELAGNKTASPSPYGASKVEPRAAIFARRQPQIHPALMRQERESPVTTQLCKLKEALGPSEREMAALSLTVGENHRDPEVVAALMDTATNDPAPSVRCCLVRCLFQLSTDCPEVVPVLEKMQSDPNDEVKKTAQTVLQAVARTGDRSTKK